MSLYTLQFALDFRFDLTFHYLASLSQNFAPLGVDPSVLKRRNKRQDNPNMNDKTTDGKHVKPKVPITHWTFKLEVTDGPFSSLRTQLCLR
jgi:hypothetical protein